ncbi:hypothetical protein J3L16_06760 [Alteromonas sp. 5E99-2]|uniref:hypothetical protein n=1 Tax=Alteromonas sp. 5E99-2 TaxID=2817683 RepID=UPI001A9875A9|nr:hypothetical protein [Alteromonas sp. 5E99-2]MBO1255383.1 hypothetical protein [Alteromonas sp. 5E99-2]
MIQWEDLKWYQKAAFWFVIGIVGWFAPEIALLFHFSGIEVVFAFVAMYYTPILRQIQNLYRQFKESLSLAVITFQSSACAKPKVYFLGVSFCCVAFAFTSSIAFSAIFFMPGLVLNGVLI